MTEMGGSGVDEPDPSPNKRQRVAVEIPPRARVHEIDADGVVTYVREVPHREALNAAQVEKMRFEPSTPLPSAHRIHART